VKQSDSRKKIGKDGMFEESAIFYRCRFQKICQYLPIPMPIDRHIPNAIYCCQ